MFSTWTIFLETSHIFCDGKKRPNEALKSKKLMWSRWKMPYLLHVRGNENEIYAAESELRDT